MSVSQQATGRHVAIACPSCGGGGAVANVALNQARELARYFQVTVLSDSFPDPADATFSCIKVDSWNFRWLRRYAHVPREWAFAVSVKRALKRLHKEEPVDVLMCHGHVLAALAAVGLKKETHIPHALVTHGDIFERPAGTYDARLTWLYKIVTSPAYKDADLIVALSPYMKQFAISGGADPSCLNVIPNGIDPAEIGLDEGQRYPRIDIYADRLELLYVGRLSIEKGVDVLVHACSLLRDRGVDFRLRIAGRGPDENALRSQIATLNLQEHIHLLGYVRRNTTGQLYRSAHMVCVPSRSDALPTVVLEAMVAGVPVIGTDTGGIRFMIQDGRTGRLVPCEDPEAMVCAVQKAWTDRTALLRMGERAHKVATEDFNWELVGKKLRDGIRRACL